VGSRPADRADVQGPGGREAEVEEQTWLAERRAATVPVHADVDRPTWLAERRAATISVYDAEAAGYESHGYPVSLQWEMVARLADLCPPGGVILDAPCGTGKYFAAVAAAGRRVVGIDQSAGMLAEAAAKGIAESLVHVGLQELAFDHEFDASMTIDAMENVCPEDWPAVLANLRRAVRPGGHLYLTVEEVQGDIVDAAYAELVARGLPAVRGEVVEGGVAGYHYYPGRDRVLAWVAAEGLSVLNEAYESGPNGEWGYRHFLLRTPAG
jgi:ubiquinone/menaquinone biosynthesis C-methylase UbiE